MWVASCWAGGMGVIGLDIDSWEGRSGKGGGYYMIPITVYLVNKDKNTILHSVINPIYCSSRSAAEGFNSAVQGPTGDSYVTSLEDSNSIKQTIRSMQPRNQTDILTTTPSRLGIT